MGPMGAIVFFACIALPDHPTCDVHVIELPAQVCPMTPRIVEGWRRRTPGAEVVGEFTCGETTEA